MDVMAQNVNQQNKRVIRNLSQGSIRMTEEEISLAVPYSCLMLRLMEGDNGMTDKETEAVVTWYAQRISRFGDAGRFANASEILTAYLSEAEDVSY